MALIATGGFRTYKKILVPLDGSELAEEVLPYVRALAECTGAQVVLLRVATIPIFEYAFADGQIYQSLRDEVARECNIYLESIEAEFKGAGFPVTRILGEGVIGDVILDNAENTHADLIALSTHGRGGLARAVLGSVADEVVRGAKVPVLLVRPQPVAK